MKNIFDRLTANQIEADHPDTEGSDDRPVFAPDSVTDPTLPVSGHQTALEVKESVQELLKHGSIDEASRAEVFRRLVVHQAAIQTVLEPLDLALRLDSHRGIAFLALAEVMVEDAKADEGWSHPLVRRQRLTLEQTLLIALLRQAFVIHEQEVGVGHSPAKIAIDELLPQFLTYVGDCGSDNKNESRLLSLLDQLKSYGLVSEVDKQHEVVIRPLIAHMANPESLSALLQVLRQQTQPNANQQATNSRTESSVESETE